MRQTLQAQADVRKCGARPCASPPPCSPPPTRVSGAAVPVAGGWKRGLQPSIGAARERVSTMPTEPRLGVLAEPLASNLAVCGPTSVLPGYLRASHRRGELSMTPGRDVYRLRALLVA